MITSLCVNPAVDRVYTVNAFNYGGMNRAVAGRIDVTTKAIHVSRVLKILGTGATATGIMFDDQRAAVADYEAAGINCEFVWQKGRTRDCLKIFDASKGVVTEINGPGSRVDGRNLEVLLDKVTDLAAKSSYFVAIGSVPQNCPEYYLAEVIARAADAGARTVMDAEGKIMALGIKKKPYMIKVNAFELATITGKTLTNRAQMVDEAKRLVDGGIKVVTVSLGAKGAFAVHEGGVCVSDGVKIDVASTVGAGDSMLGGMLHVLNGGGGVGDALKSGIAAACGTCMREGTLITTRVLYDEIIEKVQVKEL